MNAKALIAGAAATLLAPVTPLCLAEVDRGLEEVLRQAGPDEIVSAIVYLWDQGDIATLSSAMRAERAPLARQNEEVIRTLRDTADLTQANLRNELTQMQARGEVAAFEPFWIANGIRVDATADALRAVAERPDVMRVYFNPPIDSILPVAELEEIEFGGMATGGVEVGVEAVRAPEAWSLGYTGEGVLVATLDTGVDGEHPALGERWRGHDPAYANNPEWAWFDPVTNTTFPEEFHGVSHGTHTMGTVCGGPPGDSIGVAPGAQWIHAAVIDRVDLQTTVADAMAAFQWIVNPDGDPSTHWDVPDVCSNSWGLTTLHGYPECDELFWSFIDNAEAAGVVMLFSAGNSSFAGLGRPADRAMDEYRSTAVAAVDANDPTWPVASFSSRGPTNCTPNFTPATKPDIAAPGVNVRSAVEGGGYDFLSGTSMAAPHVNGVVALMRQACPDMSPDEIKQIIFDTAFNLGPPGKDNDHGWGMIDAYEAVLMTELSCTLSIQLPEGAPEFIDPGTWTMFPVTIEPLAEEIVAGSEMVFFRLASAGSGTSGQFISMPLIHAGDHEFFAPLPPVTCGEVLEFYIQAEGDGGSIRTHPPSAPDVVHSASVGNLVTEVLLDEFFDDGMPAGWEATGLWHVTSECSVPGDCQSEQWAYYGTFNEWLWPPCNAETPPNPNSGEMRTHLIAIPEVPPGGAVLVRFCHSVAMGPGSPGTHGTATFGVVDGFTHQFLFDVPTWTNYTTNVTQYAGQDIQLRWHYATSSYFSLTNYGWKVGGVEVTYTVLECEDIVPCPGDINGDGEVDVFDLIELINSWGFCINCSADLNGDGMVDVFDLLALINNWGACP